jgi:glycosyltransferase involved in cell wall biosynthesis
MRIGLIARCDDSGLGNQTLEFYKHMNPSKVMVIDFRDYNPLEQHPERYPDAWRVVRGFPKEQDCSDFLQDIDVLFTCEIPYNYRMFEIARERGIKTVLQYNWEFLDYLQDPTKPCPDLFAAPTSWMYQSLPYENKTQLRVPVNRQAIRPRDIKDGSHFVHVVGRAAHMDRNGTAIFYESLKQTRKHMKVTLFVQESEYGAQLNAKINGDRMNGRLSDNVEIDMRIGDIPNYADLYSEGSILVLPRRYGGLCLPMQEALAAGMPVIMTDVSPNRDYLPPQWCVPASITDNFMARTSINVYSASPTALARKLDWFASLSKSQMRKQNLIAQELGANLSWEVWRPKYEAAFKELMQ